MYPSAFAKDEQLRLGVRSCTKCRATKALAEFYPKRRKHAVDGYGATCKDCAKRNVLEWYKDNKARHRQKAKKWWRENREKYAESQAKHRAKNREKIRATRERWRKANMDRYMAYCSNRRAGKLRATPKWANQFFINEAYHLAWLRTKMFGYPWHVDHCVPLISPLVCGLHVENNLRVVPESINTSKGNRYWPDMP